MARIRLFIYIILFTILPAAAGVFDATSAARLLFNAESRAASDPDVYAGVLVRLDDEERGLATLAEAQARIFGRRGDIVICCVPIANLDLIDEGDGLLTASLAAQATTLLDVALSTSGVDLVHRGAGPLMQGYDGTGVVVGFADQGFDSNHPAFKDAVAKYVSYDTSAATRTEVDPALGLYADAAAHYHATHVGGILAGRKTACSSYYGAAYGAELVATTSDLNDVGILAGVDDIIAYAAESGKPAVVNMSLGSYIGPHDGTSLFNQYMAMQAEEAVICVSAGNEGLSRRSLRCSLDGDRRVRTTIASTDNLTLKGIVDIWASDSREIEFALGVWDEVDRTWLGFTDWVSSNTIIYSDVKPLAGVYQGSVAVASEVNPNNGRAHICLEVALTTEKLSEQGKWARYHLGLMVRGHEGQTVDLYADGSPLFFRAISGAPGFLDGNADMSISDLACTPGVIAVGMMNDRAVWPLADGGVTDEGFATGVANPNSSYGTLLDGTRLPHISADGNRVVSAYNGVYARLNPGAFAVSSADPDGAMWIATGGTSMSSPLVAGAVAGWLQAVPSLTPADVRRYLIASARRDMADASDPRYGSSGALDARRGLLMALGYIDAGAEAVYSDDDVIVSKVDVLGRRVADNTRGVVIITRRSADGSLHSSKILQ